jgi:hypothetical protein
MAFHYRSTATMSTAVITTKEFKGIGHKQHCATLNITHNNLFLLLDSLLYCICSFLLDCWKRNLDCMIYMCYTRIHKAICQRYLCSNLLKEIGTNVQRKFGKSSYHWLMVVLPKNVYLTVRHLDGAQTQKAPLHIACALEKNPQRTSISTWDKEA